MEVEGGRVEESALCIVTVLSACTVGKKYIRNRLRVKIRSIHRLIKQ